MHEGNFLSSWLREDGKEKRENNGNRQGEQRRDGQKVEEENETVSVKKRCVGSVSVEAFDIFSHGEIWRVVVVFLGGTFWRSLRACLIVSLGLEWMCVWCLV